MPSYVVVVEKVELLIRSWLENGVSNKDPARGLSNAHPQNRGLFRASKGHRGY